VPAVARPEPAWAGFVNVGAASAAGLPTRTAPSAGVAHDPEGWITLPADGAKAVDRNVVILVWTVRDTAHADEVILEDEHGTAIGLVQAQAEVVPDAGLSLSYRPSASLAAGRYDPTSRRWRAARPRSALGSAWPTCPSGPPKASPRASRSAAAALLPGSRRCSPSRRWRWSCPEGAGAPEGRALQ
jgi:hypothetical protein